MHWEEFDSMLKKLAEPVSKEEAQYMVARDIWQNLRRDSVFLNPAQLLRAVMKHWNDPKGPFPDLNAVPEEFYACAQLRCLRGLSGREFYSLFAELRKTAKSWPKIAKPRRCQDLLCKIDVRKFPEPEKREGLTCKIPSGTDLYDSMDAALDVMRIHPFGPFTSVAARMRAQAGMPAGTSFSEALGGMKRERLLTFFQTYPMRTLAPLLRREVLAIPRHKAEMELERRLGKAVVSDEDYEKAIRFIRTFGGYRGYVHAFDPHAAMALADAKVLEPASAMQRKHFALVCEFDPLFREDAAQETQAPSM